MAATLRVRGLDRARRNLLRQLEGMRSVVAPTVMSEMAGEFRRELVRGSKRPGRPRQVRIGKMRGGLRVRFGWYGQPSGETERYAEKALDSATRRGFRRGVEKARRRFARFR